MTDLPATKATLASLVPTQLGRMLDQGVPCPKAVRAILLGGAASAPALLERARSRGYPVLASYGSTETCSQIATQPPGATSRDDVASALPGTELRLEQERLFVRSDTLASGYYPDQPLPRDADGWFELPDRAALDAHGQLTILGRADDVIVSGGENVAPLQVEAALLSHPEVTAACVFAQPDPDLGQRVCALLVSTSGTVPGDLRAHLSAPLAGFKCPKAVAVCPELPQLASGQVDRRAAAAQFRARQPVRIR
jgi:O-succinylbenzoic acid--CoA ligase